MGVTTSVHAQFLTSHALYNLGPGLCKAVFFNRGSAEPKGCASGIQGFRRNASAQQKINLCPTSATGNFFGSQRQCKKLTALPKPPSWWGGGPLPLPKNPPSLSAFGLEFQPFGPQESTPKKYMGSISNQNCCKGFCFTEKVEKHCCKGTSEQLFRIDKVEFTIAKMPFPVPIKHCYCKDNFMTCRQ